MMMTMGISITMIIMMYKYNEGYGHGGGDEAIRVRITYKTTGNNVTQIKMIISLTILQLFVLSTEFIALR